MTSGNYSSSSVNGNIIGSGKLGTTGRFPVSCLISFVWTITSPYASKEGEMVINAAPTAAEDAPSSRSRRWWLVLVWGFIGWIASFVLRYVVRMKRPDI